METNRKKLALDLFNKRKQKCALIGLMAALGSGVAAATYQNITPMINASPAVAIGTTFGITALIAIAIQVMYDVFASGWMLIYNLATGRSLREYGRLIRCTKMGEFVASRCSCRRAYSHGGIPYRSNILRSYTSACSM